MDDLLTESVLDYQNGLVPLEKVRNQIMLVVYCHLRRYRRKGEDEVSEFLLEFHGRIEGLIGRFQDRGLPFRHFLVRSLRWQWTTFRTMRARVRQQIWLAADVGLGMVDEETLAEPESSGWEPTGALTPVSRKRLVLLALKAAPYLEEDHLEAVSRLTGVELSWLQACQYRLKKASAVRRGRWDNLVEKRSQALYRRLLAEDDARREADPARRLVHERRARMYRNRITKLYHQQSTVSTAPTHKDLAELLGMPKGSVDSSLYHLKKALSRVYSVAQYDHPSGDGKPSQKTGTRRNLSHLDPAVARRRRQTGLGS